MAENSRMQKNFLVLGFFIEKLEQTDQLRFLKCFKTKHFLLFLRVLENPENGQNN